MNENLLQKLKKVRWRDLGHVFLFLLALLPAAIYRRRHPHLWLVCEGGSEARDNGYWFFKYLREQQPQADARYAIRYDAPEYARVAALGPTVPFGSFRHWIWYLAAEANISSQKYGKPNAAVCYLLEVVLGWLKNTRIFLQHGVIKDDLPFLHADKARVAMFSCAALPEYEFVRDTFGYEPGVVQYVGLCRFDALYGAEPEPDLLLIIPTWRMYLERSTGESGRQAFLESDYYRCWSALLRDGQLDALLARCGKRAVFCTHRNMEAFEDCFSSPSERIRVLRWQDADVSALIRQAGVLITDFSSIYMDFAYMKKPVLYYQFDTEQFRQGHLPLGYFDYERDGFGPICADEESLLAAVEDCFADGCRMAPLYEERVDRFYTIHDDKNCERTYRAIRLILERRNGAFC